MKYNGTLYAKIGGRYLSLYDSNAGDVLLTSRYVEELESKNAELRKDARVLKALFAAGVDNWDGYDDAVEDVEY